MRNTARAIVGLTAVLFVASYALSQNRQDNQAIRADDGQTLYDKSSKTGAGGPAPRQELTGFWIGLVSAKLNPFPPMTPWGQEQFRSHKSHSQYSEAESNDPMKYCDPMGFPRDMLYDNRGFAFAAMPGKILQAFQFNRVWREIWTDGRELPKDVGGRSADSPDPHWFGYSVGHWEGDYTFVVDTVGVDERTWLDAPGHPHSIDMRVQERYTRVDHNTLEMAMTIDDPKTYTKPFVITNARLRWLVNQDLVEEMCVPSLMQEYLNIIADPASQPPASR
jgi:hypothetical protein